MKTAKGKRWNGKIVQVTGESKSPPVQVPIEDWCRLCDALLVSPDGATSRVVEKAWGLRANFEGACKTIREQAAQIEKLTAPSP